MIFILINLFIIIINNMVSCECSTLDALMAKWPSMHARLKGMKPHLPPKKDDGKPTLGKKENNQF